MRPLLIALSIFGALPVALAQYGPIPNTVAVDGITVPRTMPRLLDAETERFRDFRREAAKIGPVPDYLLTYWQKRLELAAQFDSKQVSVEGWIAARKIQDEMVRAEGESRSAKLAEQLAAMQAQQAERARAAAAAADDQRRAALLGIASRLLTPPQPPPVQQCQYQTNANGSGSMICR